MIIEQTSEPGSQPRAPCLRAGFGFRASSPGPRPSYLWGHSSLPTDFEPTSAKGSGTHSECNILQASTRSYCRATGMSETGCMRRAMGAFHLPLSSARLAAGAVAPFSAGAAATYSFRAKHPPSARKSPPTSFIPCRASGVPFHQLTLRKRHND